MKATGSKLIRVLNIEDGYVDYDVERQLYYLTKNDVLKELTESEFSIFKSSCKAKENVTNKSNLC